MAEKGNFGSTVFVVNGVEKECSNFSSQRGNLAPLTAIC